MGGTIEVCMRMRYFLMILLAVAAVSAPAKDKDKKKSEPAAPAPAASAIGQKAPGFSLAAFPGGKARLKDFQGKWLVICFYPKANAPKDVLEMASLREAWPQIQKLNASLLGVSMDPPAVVEKFQRDQALPFTLACDVEKQASTAYGALGLGGLFSARKAVIIDPQGRLAGEIDKGPEKQYGARVIETLRALQAAARPPD